MSTKITINRFDGAIVNDPRDTALGVARTVTNFDVITKQGSLIPYRDSEDGNSNAANDLMRTWCIAKNITLPTSGSDYSLYGLGRQTASNKVRIFKKTIDSGTNGLTNNSWTETSNNLATQTTPNYNCFVYYPNQGLIFGLHGNRYIWSYDPTGSVAFGDTLFDLTSFTNCAQGVVHSKDDRLYIPVDNKIYYKDGASAFALGLTLPTQYYITSICEFNNFIAIAAAPVAGVGNSRVFIWDRSVTLTVLTENIDWGYGIIKVLDEIGGYLIGISLDGGGTVRFNDRITFRYYTGSGAIAFKEILGATSSVLLTSKQKINNRIYFMLSVFLNSTLREGVWSFGKNNTGVFNLVHERTPNNDTVISAGGINGFFYIGDYLFQGYTTAGSASAVSKTNDNNAAFSATSVLETQINQRMPEEDKHLKKQLVSVGVRYVSSASGQVVVKAKVDGGSYVTVLTATVTGVNEIEQPINSTIVLNTGRELEFRLESTLGAEITGFIYEYDVLETNI